MPTVEITDTQQPQKHLGPAGGYGLKLPFTTRFGGEIGALENTDAAPSSYYQDTGRGALAQVGDRVASWTDRDTGRHAVQETDTDRPTLTEDGLLMEGSQRLVLPTDSPDRQLTGAEFTLFVGFHVPEDSPVTNPTLVHLYPPGNFRLVCRPGSVIWLLRNGQGDGEVISNGVSTPSTTAALRYGVDPGGGGYLHELFLQGEVTGEAAQNRTQYYANPNGIVVGNTDDGDAPFGAPIPFVRLYDRRLSDDEIALLHRFVSNVHL